MKCPICGSTLNDTDTFCSNCGSAVKSETSGYMDSIDTSNLNENSGFGKRNTSSNNMGSMQNNSAQYVGGNQAQQTVNGQPQGTLNNNQYNQPQFNAGNYAPYTVAPAHSKSKGSTKTLISLIVFVVILVIGFGGRYYYKNYSTKTLEGTGYTLTAPRTMTKNSNGSVFALDSFSNNEVVINSIKLEYSDVEAFGYGKGASPKEMFDLLSSSISSTITVSKTDANYMYYTQVTGGKTWYGMTSMKEGNGGYYFFDFLCEKKNQSKYENKFKEWAQSVKIK